MNIDTKHMRELGRQCIDGMIQSEEYKKKRAKTVYKSILNALYKQWLRGELK